MLQAHLKYQDEHLLFDNLEAALVQLASHQNLNKALVLWRVDSEHRSQPEYPSSRDFWWQMVNVIVDLKRLDISPRASDHGVCYLPVSEL